MTFDYSRLRGKIREVFGTETAFSKSLGIGRVSLSQRLNNMTEFSRSEMLKSCDLLSIPYSEIPIYFFAAKVQKVEPDNKEV